MIAQVIQMKQQQHILNNWFVFTIFSWIGFFILFSTVPFVVFADESCLNKLTSQQDEILSSKDRALLEKQIDLCQREIEKDQQRLLNQNVKLTDTEKDIAIIDYEVNQALLRIRSSDLSIYKTNQEIIKKEEVVEVLNNELLTQQEILKHLMQQINEKEQEGFLSLILSDFSLSSFFSRTGDYESLRLSLADSIKDINSLRTRRTANVMQLNQQQELQNGTRNQQQAEKNRVSERRVEKESILAYQKEQATKIEIDIEAKSQRIAQIQNRLFELRGGGTIKFGEAVRLAELSRQLTGINPAFLLGLIKHESDLGRNVGTGSWRVDMHPLRDQPVFPFITEALGFDPDDVMVSANPGFGWGGAMGPAQFIPSTWVEYGGFVNEKTGTCCYNGALLTGEGNLGIGASGGDVRRLQVFLNTQNFTIQSSGAGSPGNETSTYGSRVAAAVTRFQERYSSYILRPGGYSRGTGTVGPRTKTAINLLNFYSGPWRYKKSEDQIRSLTGSNTPSNPWNPRDAFLASSLYLVRLGAKNDECTAARKYYAGGNWRSAVARSYCQSVLANANTFQREIDFLRS